VSDLYVEVSAYKAAMNITKDAHDDDIERAILAASRAIDDATHRYFYLKDASADEVRYFTPRSRTWLEIGDLAALSTTSDPVLLDMDSDGSFESVLTENVDFVLEPLNATEDEVPYERLRMLPLSSYWLIEYPRSVQITGRWGWSSVPTVIEQATLILASRYLKRTDAPFGIAGLGPQGEGVRIAKSDPDVYALIEPLIKKAVLA